MNIHVKITTLCTFMDMVCPYKCKGCEKIGKALCGCCIFYITQNYATKRSGMFVGGVRDGLLARLVVDYKYNSIRGLAEPLAEIVSAAIPRDFGDNVIVVPLPTIAKHIRERGFDHMWLMGCELARMRGWKCEKVLLRVNNTVQVGADAEMRVKQAESAYRVWERGVKADVTYLLLDDVSTTGASLNAAERVLADAGAKRIYRAVVAVSGSIEEDEEQKGTA